MCAVENQLKKWLISQEPIKNVDGACRKMLIKDYIGAQERDRLIRHTVSAFSGVSPAFIAELTDDALTHMHPLIMTARGQFQAVTEDVFTIDGVVFTSRKVCQTLRRAEYVFATIITTGKEIEDYTLVHVHPLHRKIIRYVCAESNKIGQRLLNSELCTRYAVRRLVQMYPGESDWEMQEGIRVFELFGDMIAKNRLSITEHGTPNVAYTSFGLSAAF